MKDGCSVPPSTTSVCIGIQKKLHFQDMGFQIYRVQQGLDLQAEAYAEGGARSLAREVQYSR